MAAFQEFYELGKRGADKAVSCVKINEKFECKWVGGGTESRYIRNILNEESKADTIRHGQ